MGYSRKLNATKGIRRDDTIVHSLPESDSDNSQGILYRAIAVPLGK